ncbi:MAG: MarR family transcriptional regulator, lower aerobic nicotinate degradation pathway regulator [Methylobacteriaceae bacterium]|nr:MarR family transcriptional regulator, lower aerobic nicotinate degradation pathway regulator [Methylobacteriaceae bacterium]
MAEALNPPFDEITAGAAAGPASGKRYLLDEQVGFLLRQASQRHTAIFAARMIEDLTPTQWAALARLKERGPCSQNLLGRLTAMDAATIKGVVDRLVARGLAETRSDPQDSRRLTIALTRAGGELVGRATPAAQEITQTTLAPLSASERRTIVRLLGKLK